MRKEVYILPEIEVVLFQAEDIITTSLDAGDEDEI